MIRAQAYFNKLFGLTKNNIQLVWEQFNYFSLRFNKQLVHSYLYEKQLIKV